MGLAVLRRSGAPAALLLLAACASSPPPPGPGAQAQAVRPPSKAPVAVCQRLFVSPAGEPFRRAEGGPCPLEVWFAGADADHDGALDRAEFVADAGRFFATLDRNRDGVLGPEEIARYEQVVLPEIVGRRAEAAAASLWVEAAFVPQFGGAGGGGGYGGGMGGAGGLGGGGGRGEGHGRGGDEQVQRPSGPEGSSPDGAARYGLLDEPEPVAACDLNFDGLITRQEALTRAAQRFDTLDADGSGRLTLAELQARLAARAGRRPEGRPAGARPGAGGGRRHRS